MLKANELPPAQVFRSFPSPGLRSFPLLSWVFKSCPLCLGFCTSFPSRVLRSNSFSVEGVKELSFSVVGVVRVFPLAF